MRVSFGTSCGRILPRLGLTVLAAASIAQAGLIGNFSHTYGFGDDPNAVMIVLNVFDAQAGGRYLWEYTVTNNSYDPAPGTSNGFSGFELFLPSPIPEIAGVSPNASSTPPWEVNCCSGNPVEWDIRNSDGPGVMPGEVGVFSFTTDPRQVAINNSGWFHTWQDNIQTDIVGTPGMHVPLVPGLEPEIPEPGTMTLMTIGIAGVVLGALRRRRSRG